MFRKKEVYVENLLPDIYEKDTGKKYIFMIIFSILVIAITATLFFLNKKGYSKEISYIENGVEIKVTDDNLDTVIKKIENKKELENAIKTLEEEKSKMFPNENENAISLIENLTNSTEKIAYLTFDDGPSKTITPQILDVLKSENVLRKFLCSW